MYLYLYAYLLPIHICRLQNDYKGLSSQSRENLVAMHILCSAELATQPTGGLWRGTAVAAAGVESQTGAELHS